LIGRVMVANPLQTSLRHRSDTVAPSIGLLVWGLITGANISIAAAVFGIEALSSSRGELSVAPQRLTTRHMLSSSAAAMKDV